MKNGLCGENLQYNNTHKKRNQILYVLFTLVMIAGLSSCRNNGIEATKSNNTGSSKTIFSSINSSSTVSSGVFSSSINSSKNKTPSSVISNNSSSSKSNSSGLSSSNTGANSSSNSTSSNNASSNNSSSNSSSIPPISAAPLPMLIGANMPGGEMVYNQANTSNPISGQDYLLVSHQDIDYIKSKGMNFIRLVFSWEGMQNTLYGSLSTNNYANDMIDRVNYATSIGLYVLIEPHGAIDEDFGAYRGNKVGSSQVPDSAFADFWGKMATLYKSNPHVLIGLSNEPHDTSTAQWFGAAQAAITAIRAAGFNNAIFVPGIGYTGAENWTDPSIDPGYPQMANSTAFMKLVDPQKNLVASVHVYADPDDGGGDASIVSSTVFVDRLTDVTNWAKQNNVRIHISEFAVAASNPLAQSAVNNLTNYISNNSTTLIGGSFWAYGPPAWWSSYLFTLDPTNNYTTDSPQMKLLTGFIALNKK